MYIFLKLFYSHRNQITGAGHGLGRELAIQLSSMGCIIVCWDNDIDGNRATMREVSKNGGEVSIYLIFI